MERRAVITGLGVFTPLAARCRRVVGRADEGRSGVRPITLFDASAYAVSFGGELPDFDPKKFILGKEPRKALKMMARPIQIGVACANVAWPTAASTAANSTRRGSASIRLQPDPDRTRRPDFGLAPELPGDTRRHRFRHLGPRRHPDHSTVVDVQIPAQHGRVPRVDLPRRTRAKQLDHRNRCRRAVGNRRSLAALQRNHADFFLCRTPTVSSTCSVWPGTACSPS